ncbi:serine/threonine-protein kinase [Oxynema aestuarii]|uniref:Serine/threonine protein kinase n=1 Tax=Oxynema aestuarii AP17 TaxID=2064643 RepID=A0A6H1TZP3_9CYAN|nr:serine/threonine-protein kinase [Oxynema aestuarii]QIZ71243.1 serine/threonine protein kinase [Oxynema aestuarii AP17]
MEGGTRRIVLPRLSPIPLLMPSPSMNAKIPDRSRAALQPLQRQLPKYRILERVGSGQFGTVFCAIERKTGRLVALKELTHRRLSTSQFLRELGFLLTLQHPHIVTCRALENTPTARYLVMDYCEGGTLRNLLQRDRSLTLAEGLDAIRAVLDGLDLAHRRGIVHCDLKPENILLSLSPHGWKPKLSDFGIARRLSELSRAKSANDETADAIGAPAYTAPEGFLGLYAPAADIYSVGVLLFELLFGCRPFGGSPGQLMWAHLNRPLEIATSIPKPLETVVRKALAKLPARRYHSAAEMAEAIARCQGDPTVAQWGDRRLPLSERETEGDPPSSEPTVIVERVGHQQAIFAPSYLVGGEGFLYGAAGDRFCVWNLEGEIDTLKGNRPITGLCPLPGGCAIATGGQLSWFDRDRDLLDVLLDGDRDFRMAADPTGQTLAIVIGGTLNFYSVAALTGSHQPLVPQHQTPLPTQKLPQILALDRRHWLLVWCKSTPEASQTVFQLYSRSAKLLGSFRVPLAFESLWLTGEPDCQDRGAARSLFGGERTLLGLSSHPATAWRLQLMPPQLEILPLCEQPLAAIGVPGGTVVALGEGGDKRLRRRFALGWLDDCGHLHRQCSWELPTATPCERSRVRMAPWGDRGFVLSTPTPSGAELSFFQTRLSNIE